MAQETGAQVYDVDMGTGLSQDLVSSSVSQDGPAGSCFQISFRESCEPILRDFSTVDLERTLVLGLSLTAN